MLKPGLTSFKKPLCEWLSCEFKDAKNDAREMYLRGYKHSVCIKMPICAPVSNNERNS